MIGFDEQFYLLVGDRLLHGALPFVDIFDRKPVGLFLIFAGARALGGDGFVQYKLVALGFVTVTAFLMYRLARRRTGPIAALTAAAFYIVWLDFMEGEGGQSPVFYNLPILAAAAIIVAAARRRTDPRAAGAGAMALVGLALQIKYSAVFEGIYFGCWLILLAWRTGQRSVPLACSIALWIGCALAPTAAALLAYAGLGHSSEFLFANFVSLLGQGRSGAKDQMQGAAVMVAILLLPVLLVSVGWRDRSRTHGDVANDHFLLGWFVASVVGVVLYWRFPSPQYAMPVLLPLAGLLAPVLDTSRRRRVLGIALVLFGAVAAQVVLYQNELHKGGAREADLVAKAADPAGAGCIYVYDGYPGLYMLTRSCLPTRWPFPAHLSTMEEARVAALGVDPLREIARILATHPVAIIDDYPRFSGGNPAAHRLLQRTLDAEYALAACVRTGPSRVRLVYRRMGDVGTRPKDCPSEAALR